MSPAQQAQPLPECSRCGRPVRRDVWLANGGLCTVDRHRADNLPAQLELEAN